MTESFRLSFSLQEKQPSQTYLQGGKIISQSLKRKRRTTEHPEDSENIYPPTKVAALSSHTSYSEPCPAQTIDNNLCAPHRTSPLNEQHDASSWSELCNATCFLTPSGSGSASHKPNALPSFPWADGSQVWSIMCLGDQKTVTQREPQMFQRHPTLQPRMRAILLDWLIEVCEVYKLHRETYYLAMDYIDRYLSTHNNVPKNQLQLIGITCLFIAAKVSDILFYFHSATIIIVYMSIETCLCRVIVISNNEMMIGGKIFFPPCFCASASTQFHFKYIPYDLPLMDK